MVDRVQFTPERLPENLAGADLVRWHTEQWARVANYLRQVETELLDLRARVEALEGG
jgi:hypothetical protein